MSDAGRILARGDYEELGEEVMSERYGFWGCFYCANTHNFTTEKCKCICHKNETPEHAKQNADWLEMRRALKADQKKIDALQADGDGPIQENYNDSIEDVDNSHQQKALTTKREGGR